MDRKQKFFDWLTKDGWYQPQNADCHIIRLQHIGTVVGRDIYNYSTPEASKIREEILSHKLLPNLDKKQRKEYGVSLARYSAFASQFPLAISV